MPRSAAIRVYRAPDIWMDRNRLYKVIVDGAIVGEVWPGKSERISVEPGPHKVRVKVDFMKSNEMDVSAIDGQTVELACRGYGLCAVIEPRDL